MEIFQDYGNDLVLTDAGDLMTADGVVLSEQRVVRRLLTAPITVSNPPDYLEHPDYGAGLPQFVGQLATPEIVDQIRGLIISQMFLEESVARTPAPVIDITMTPNNFKCIITYTNAISNSQSVITLDLP